MSDHLTDVDPVLNEALLKPLFDLDPNLASRYTESNLQRYRDHDGNICVPADEIINAETAWAQAASDRDKLDPRHWDGKSAYKDLPF